MRTVSLFSIFFALLTLATPAHALEEYSNRIISGTAKASIAGLGVADLNFDLSVTGKSYELTSKSESTGILNLFFNFQSGISSKGYYRQGEIKPDSYLLNGFSDGVTRQIELKYDSEGQVSDLYLSPTPKEEGRQIIPASAIVQTIDPATLFVQFINPSRVQEAVACDYQQLLYDGYRLSRVSLRPIDGDIVKAGIRDADDVFQLDTAVGCYLEAELLYGRTEKEEEQAKDRDQTPATIWFAKPRGLDTYVPAALNKRTRFGTAVVWVQRLEISGIASKDDMARK